MNEDLRVSEEQNTPLEEKEKSPNVIWEAIRFAVVALIVVIPIRIYIASPFIVSGSSMDPTFETGHYLIVDQLSYRFENPERGQVVVFRYPRDTSKFFIKRIIGLPGETISFENGSVRISSQADPEGFVLEEPYIKHPKEEVLPQVKLRDNEYFVMGDNREASSDSRVWGPLNEKFITGRALVRLVPITEIETYPGDVKDFTDSK